MNTNKADACEKKAPPARISRQQRAIAALAEYGCTAGRRGRGSKPLDHLAVDAAAVLPATARSNAPTTLCDAYGRIRQSAAAGVAVLSRILTDPQASESSKIQAAKCLIEQDRKGIEWEIMQDVLERLAIVESSRKAR